MGEGAAWRRRRLVSDRTVLFGSAVLMVSLWLAVFGGIGSGVGASAAPATTSTLVQTQTTQSTPTTQPAPTTTTTSPPTTTTTAPPTTTTTTVLVASTPPPPPPPASTGLPARGAATAYGCGPAVTYLSAYSAPGFTFECPGNALGHQAMTCINEPGVCANEQLIAIADPCPAAYMNEASNSWVLTGASTAPIDPYGACS